ncbi:unnamed protein product [Anisakis simplex]|uniref:mRNA-capping enzyme (inferred by orthology to a C. elegans protein) n=1 Tax=Anisakis simplex TaxID=6269 RepID=A0A0M3K3R0_ANISI|nr:unnamed protein product [Anisakis simplex]
MDIDEDSLYPDRAGPNETKAKLGPPDRWMYCPPMGSVVAKHFLPFKTPLCKLYDDQIEPKYQFHPRDVFAKKLNDAEPGAKIVLWIDLTKTNRYYGKKEVELRNCTYLKMPMKGHGETPSVEDTESFCRAVREALRVSIFLSSHKYQLNDPNNRLDIREMCGAKRDGFPGSQPVSMERSPERDNLKFLAENPYMVSWKADGVRYMVLINDEDEIYAFDRDNNVFRIPSITFPHRKESRHLRDTLIDAEVIIDKVPGEDGQMKEIPRMLIYDIIKFEVCIRMCYNCMYIRDFISDVALISGLWANVLANATFRSVCYASRRN